MDAPKPSGTILLKEADATGRLAKKLATYFKLALLALDGVGYVPLTRNESNIVFQLVDLGVRDRS